MLHDRLVVGIRDVRQSAAVKEQQGQLKQLKEGSMQGKPDHDRRLANLKLAEEEPLGAEISRKGGARGKMQGGAKSGQRKPQCKRCGKDHFPSCRKMPSQSSYLLQM